MTTAEPGTRDWGSTVRVRAEVHATGGRIYSGFLHLLPFASIHLGQETPDDVLNREEAFFPLTDATDHTVFLCKAQVLLVAMEQVSGQDPDRMSVARTIKLTVELSDGGVYSGTVSSELPPTRTRAIDFLNSSSGFFSLHDAETVRYINRSQVRRVIPLD